jgi:hypothetical protein
MGNCRIAARIRPGPGGAQRSATAAPLSGTSGEARSVVGACHDPCTAGTGSAPTEQTAGQTATMHRVQRTPLAPSLAPRSRASPAAHIQDPNSAWSAATRLRICTAKHDMRVTACEQYLYRTIMVSNINI